MKYKVGQILDGKDGNVWVYAPKSKAAEPNGWVNANTPEGMKVYEIAAGNKEQTLEPPFMASVGRGMMDVAQGVRQVAPEWAGGMTPQQEQQEKADIALYEKGQGDNFDWGRMGGQVAATAPLAAIPGMGATGLLGRTAMGGVSGLLAGGSLFESVPGTRANNMIYGGAGGAAGAAVLPPLITYGARGAAAVGRGVSRLWRQIMPKDQGAIARQLAAAARNAGVSLDDLSAGARAGLDDDAARAFIAGELDADALVRKAQAQSFGFVDDAAPMNAQMTRDPRAWTEQSRISQMEGAGDEVAARLNTQGKQARKVLEGDFRGRVKADPTVDAYQAGAALESGVKAENAVRRKAVGELFDTARAANPDALLPAQRLKDATAKIMKDHRNSIPADVRRRVISLTKEGAEITPQDLQQLDDLMIRHYEPTKPAMNYAMADMKDAVRGLMDETAEEFGGAYRAAIEGAKTLHDDIGKKGATKALTAPEARTDRIVKGSLLGGDPKELERLRRFLQKNRPEEWQAGVSAAWKEIEEAATLTNDSISGTRLMKVLKRAGPRLNSLFGEKTAKDLLRFARVLKDLQVAPFGAVVNNSGTSPTIFNTIRSAIGGMSNSVPGGGLVTPMLNASALKANEAAQRAVAQRALGAVPTTPLTQLTPELTNRLTRGGAALSPAVGLLTANQ